MTQKLNKLMWFKDNIELQLEDIELELMNKQVDLYFDTSDIQTAVMGLRAFYDDGHFKKHRFERKKTFVNTLIAVGWLGNFNLLPPHLSEFYGKAERNFNLPATTDWENEVKKFLKDLRLLDDENINESFHTQSEEEMHNIYSRKAGNGIDWFKAIYSMTPWHRKLGVWLRNGLLNIEERNFDYEKTIKSENFDKLKRIFDGHRELETINNTVDAAALAFLIELVERFNQEETDRIPRFFVPHESKNLWNDILQELKWDEKFICNYEFSGSSSTTIFRKEDYFLYKIAFRRDDKANNSGLIPKKKSDKDLRIEHDKLSALKKQAEVAIKSLPDEKDKLYNQTLTKIHIDQDLEELINSLQEYSVLDANWFKHASAKEFVKILSETRHSKEIVEEQRMFYEDRDFKKFITDQLKDKRSELIEELEDFRLASQLYDTLYTSIEGLKKRLKNVPALENDEFFSHLGLLRYGFPRKIEERISMILDNLRSGESDKIRSGCAEAIRCYITGRKDPANNVGSCMVIAGILLAVNNNYLLEQLFDNIGTNLQHFSLKIVFSEFLFRREPRKDSNIKKSLKILGELEREWKDKKTSKEDKADLSVGLAYLNYWAWRSSGATREWELQIKKLSPRSNLLLNHIIDKSIYHADYAYLNLPDDYIEKKVYALNQYLFCSIEGGDPKLFIKLKERKNELQDHRGKRGWQFRFEDTIARYYVRKALLPNQNGERKERFINWAYDAEEEAKNKSDGDLEIDRFHDILKRIWEDMSE